MPLWDRKNAPTAALKQNLDVALGIVRETHPGIVGPVGDGVAVDVDDDGQSNLIQQAKRDERPSLARHYLDDHNNDHKRGVALEKAAALPEGAAAADECEDGDETPDDDDGCACCFFVVVIELFSRGEGAS